LFLLLAASLLLSQEIPAEIEESLPTGDADQPFSPDDSTLFVIVDYEYTVKGRTLPFALLYTLVENDEFRKGEIITGKTNLEKYIGDITQIYINQRVLKDNVEVSYSTDARNEDGAYPVTIMIKVEDSFNIIALPGPYYKNGAFDLTIKARDYNFLGTMHPLQIDLGYNYDGGDRNTFLFGVYFDTPFKAFGYYWNFNIDNNVQYRVDAPVYFQNTTGLSMNLPFRSTTFIFGFNESFYLNQENSDWAKENGYGLYQDGLYMVSNMSVSWRIPTGLTVSRFGDLAYTPVISATFTHEFPDWPLVDDRKGPFMSFGHYLGFGRIDWHGNYREGLSFSMGNSYQYNFNRMFYDISFGITGIGHFIVSSFFGVSARLMYNYWYSSDVTSAGQYISYNLRGVEDSSITAYHSLLLNIDLPFRLFAFTPSKWFNSRKFRFFDLEVHAAPVLDLALYHQKSFDGDKTLYSPAGYAATGGMELVVFSLFMRNLYVRLGFAINIKEFIKARPLRIPDGDNREIYLIMGHFY